MTLSRNKIQALQFISKTLTGQNIQFQITGRCAAVFYGVESEPYDIDIDVYKRDISCVEQLLGDRLVTPYHHFNDGVFDMHLFTTIIEGESVDVSQIEDAYYVDATGKRRALRADIRNVQWFNLEGVDVPVQNRDELITYKKLVARDHDLKDVAVMEGVQKAA